MVSNWHNHRWAGFGVARVWAADGTAGRSNAAVRATCELADDVFATFVATRIKGGQVIELNLRQPILHVDAAAPSSEPPGTQKPSGTSSKSLVGDEIARDRDKPLYEEHAKRNFMVNTWCMRCLMQGAAHCEHPR